MRRIGEIARIHAARKGDQHAATGPKRFVEGDLLGAEVGERFHAAKVRGDFRGVKQSRSEAKPGTHYPSAVAVIHSGLSKGVITAACQLCWLSACESKIHRDT
jgi:hypothetical protein